MTIRALPVAEWASLVPCFQAHGAALPDPALARILVAEQDGNRLGFLVMQLVPHLEPIYVEPAARGTGVSLALASAAQASFPSGASYFAFAGTPTVEALARRAGLTKRPWAVYEGQGTAGD